MAINAKVDFMNQIEKGLSTEVTAAEMSRVMRIVADTLDGYDIQGAFLNYEDQNDLLDCYLSAMKVQGRSPKTVTRYEYVIKRMLKAVQVPVRRVTVYHLRDYIQSEKERGIQDSTLEGNREIFTAFFNWLQRESLIEKNPTANLGTIKRAKKKKAIFTETELERLNMSCNCTRDRAIIAFLQSTGCRVSEMAELDRDAIDFQNMECVVHGKGNKERTVFLNEVAAMYLKEYLTMRKDVSPALFVGRNLERLNPGGVRIMLNRVAKRAGVEHVHPHKFRRTLATNMARHGMGIQEIASILGHDKIDTTISGYVVLKTDDIHQSYNRYS